MIMMMMYSKSIATFSKRLVQSNSKSNPELNRVGALSAGHC